MKAGDRVRVTEPLTGYEGRHVYTEGTEGVISSITLGGAYVKLDDGRQPYIPRERLEVIKEGK